MPRPGARVRRDNQPGLWIATAGFGIRVGSGSPTALLVPATSVVFSRESPLPSADSRCTIGGRADLSVDPHLSPQTLASTQPLRHDYAPVVVDPASTDASLPGYPGVTPVLGSPESGALHRVETPVTRNGEITMLDGTLVNLAAPVTRVRGVSPPGGIIGVTYSSVFRLQPDTPLDDEDAGAAVVRVADNGELIALGMILMVESPQAALVTGIMRIFNRLPLGSHLL